MRFAGCKTGATFYILLLLSALFLFSDRAAAERLPMKTYTAVDGLANNRVHRIVRDSRGFIWFCTTEGLSRFDGYSFVNYTTDNGLPFHSINDLLEAPDGAYWLATNGRGVIHFAPKISAQKDDEQSRFAVYPVGDKPVSNRVNMLFRDRNGRLWAATDGGLYVLDEKTGEAEFRRVELRLAGHQDETVQVWALLEDREGGLWIGTKFGLVHRLPDERMIYYRIRPSGSSDTVRALLLDRNDRLWIGHQSGLLVVNPATMPVTESPTGAVINLNPKTAILHMKSESYAALAGLSGSPIMALLQASDGAIWIGNQTGLAQFSEGRLHSYTTAQGLDGKDIWTITEDGEGSLWLGTSSDGATRIYKNGFTLFGKADGLGQVIGSIIETPSGELCVTSSDYRLSRFDGSRFVTVKLNVAKTTGRWLRYHNVIEDHAGEWWVATTNGLYRFPRVSGIEQLARARPKAVYTTADGLAGNELTALFEDSHGDIWTGNFAPSGETLTRWERATGTFHRYSADDGLPAFNMVIAFCEDRAGDIWIGLFAGGLVRYRAGRFKTFTPDDGLPVGTTHDVHLDRAGRLWVITDQGGLARIDDPSADQPHLKVYTTADGLSSNGMRSITEDAQGHIYAASPHAIDRLDPATGQIKHYHLTEELDVSEIAVAFCDRHDALWFGSPKSLSRLLPESNRPVQPPPILIGGLRVAGVERSVSDLGEREIAGLEMEAGQNQVQIDFFGIAFESGGALRYQYKLEGLDPDWNAPTSQRTISYGSLAPGAYRFLVRAIAADGTVSTTPATASFRILPPLWQRWWFITFSITVVGVTVYRFYRYRVARLIELERVRMRIATDLHDDIGSNLSLIAMVSEVARQQINQDGSRAEDHLSLIARTSRQSVDAMSDIVWAVNPKRDHLHDLVERMRRFASDTLAPREIDFRFAAPPARSDMKLGSELRRQFYLIFKEGVSNLARHSQCSEADIDLSIYGSQLVLRLGDNGKGFDPTAAGNGYGGNGLASMRERAAALGGQLEIVSDKQEGTTITLKVPLGRR